MTIEEKDKLLNEEFAKLKSMVSDFDHQVKSAADGNEVYKRNWVEDNYILFGNVQNKTLRDYENFYCHSSNPKVNRKVKAMITKIEDARKILYKEIEPQLDVLKSLYENKDPFWKDSGNLPYYISVSTFEYVALKLSELIQGSQSAFSLKKIITQIMKDKDSYYKNNVIQETYIFTENEDKFTITLPTFDIDAYLNQLELVFNSYTKTIKNIKKFRNTKCAHYDYKSIKSRPRFKVKYNDLKTIFALVEEIYSQIFYTIAPDKFWTKKFKSNIDFHRMNDITKFYKKYELQKKKELRIK